MRTQQDWKLLESRPPSPPSFGSLWLRGEYTGIMQYMLLDVRAWGVEKQPSFHPFQFIITLWGKRNWWLWWAQSSCCFCILRWRGDVFLRPGLWGQPLRLPFTLTLSHRPEYTIGLKSCSVRANFSLMSHSQLAVTVKNRLESIGQGLFSWLNILHLSFVFRTDRKSVV